MRKAPTNCEVVGTSLAGLGGALDLDKFLLLRPEFFSGEVEPGEGNSVATHQASNVISILHPRCRPFQGHKQAFNVTDGCSLLLGLEFLLGEVQLGEADFMVTHPSTNMSHVPQISLQLLQCFEQTLDVADGCSLFFGPWVKSSSSNMTLLRLIQARISAAYCTSAVCCCSVSNNSLMKLICLSIKNTPWGWWQTTGDRPIVFYTKYVKNQTELSLFQY